MRGLAGPIFPLRARWPAASAIGFPLSLSSASLMICAAEHIPSSFEIRFAGAVWLPRR